QGYVSVRETGSYRNPGAITPEIVGSIFESSAQNVSQAFLCAVSDQADSGNDSGTEISIWCPPNQTPRSSRTRFEIGADSRPSAATLMPSNVCTIWTMLPEAHACGEQATG